MSRNTIPMMNNVGTQSAIVCMMQIRDVDLWMKGYWIVGTQPIKLTLGADG
jgi:hypothetical protein